MAGSLRQRGKTSWQLRVLAGRDEITGKKSYVSKTFRGGRREAERELARLVAEVEAGSTTAAAGTVAELCNKWFEYACPNLSPAVSAEYRRLLDRRILPRWGSTPVRRLRTSELDGWYSQLRRSGSATGGPLSPNSVVRVHAILRRALNQGVRWGWITTNPAVAATPPRVLRRQLDIPSPADIARLIAAAELVNPALPAFIRLAAASGARRGELCALRWRNIDLAGRSLHIAGAIVQINQTVIEKDTKTHAERRVSLDDATRDTPKHRDCGRAGSGAAAYSIVEVVPSWTFLTNHAHVLVCIAQNTEVRRHRLASATWPLCHGARLIRSRREANAEPLASIVLSGVLTQVESTSEGHGARRVPRCQDHQHTSPPARHQPGRVRYHQ